jgi:rhodanese-related sulfurtransferase/DNA-binding MarR family transcriptional regulator
MSTPALKRALYESVSRVAYALANGNRLQILEFVAQGERSVDELAAMTGLSVANASQHLRALRQAGLVASRKDGKRVLYVLAGQDVVALYDTMRRVAQGRIAEVDRLLNDFLSGHRDEIEPVPASELLARSKQGLVTVIDVRPPEEFAAGHLPGAINVPIEQLDDKLKSLPKRKEVVAYCRGPYCLMSFEAVLKLRARGWKARRLADGFPEWRAAGLPVER